MLYLAYALLMSSTVSLVILQLGKGYYGILIV